MQCPLHTHTRTRTHTLISRLTPCDCHHGASVFDGLMVSWGSQIQEEEISMCSAKPPDGREEAGLGGGGALLSPRRQMPCSLESWELAQVTSQDCPHSLRRTQKQRGPTVSRRLAGFGIQLAMTASSPSPQGTTVCLPGEACAPQGSWLG